MLFTKKPIKIIDGIYDYIGESLDNYVENYEEISKDNSKNKPIAESLILSNICEIITTYLDSERVIDIGCGFGNVLYNAHAKEKVAIDISLNQLQSVDDNIIRIRAYAENIPIVSNYFDTVICSDVYEHVLDTSKLVKEIVRLLKPKGSLLFATPWKQDLSVYDSKEYQRKFKKYKYIHLRSVNDTLIKESFSKDFGIINSTLITANMDYMALKPYPIKFIHFKKKNKENGT